MASANQIRINTGIDTSAINKELANLQKKFQDFKSSLKSDDIQKEIDKIAKSLEELDTANENRSKRIKEITKEMERMESINQRQNGDKFTFSTDSSLKKYQELENELAKIKQDYDDTLAKSQQLEAEESALKAQKEQQLVTEQQQQDEMQNQIDTLEYQRQVLSELQAEDTKNELKGTTLNPQEYEANIALLQEMIEKDKERYGTESEIVKELEKEVAYQREMLGYVNKTNKGEGEEETKVKNINSYHRDNVKQIKKCNSGLLKGIGSVKTMALAIFGARSAYIAIRKIVSEVTEDNKQLANTIQGIWGSLGALFAPFINSIIQGLANVLNYAMKIVQVLTGVNMLAKAQESIAKKNGGGNKNGNLASFDKSEVLKKNEDSGVTNDSYLKNVELSEKLQDILARIKGYFSEIGTSIKDWWSGLDFQPLIDSLGRLWEAFEHLGSVLGDYFLWILENILEPLGSWTIEEAVPAVVDVLASAFEVLATALEVAEPYLEEIWNTYLKPIAQWIGDSLIGILEWLKEKLDELNKKMQENPEEAGKIVTAILLIIGVLVLVVPLIKKLIDHFKESEDPISKATTNFTGFLESIGKAVEYIAILGGLALVLKEIANVVDSISGLIQTMNESGTTLLDLIGLILAILVPLGVAIALIIAFAPEIASAMLIVGVALAPLALTLPPILEALGNFISTIAPGLISVIQAIGDTIVKVIDGILDSLGEFIEQIGPTMCEIIKQIGDTIEQIGGVILDVIDGVLDAFERAWNLVKDIVNSILGAIETFVNGMVKMINKVIDALNSIQVDIPDWVPVFGGKHFGLSLGHVSEVTLPRLAKGAVIQPNKPFMAMLGDQKNGNNLEAPESLIRQIVAEESGTKNITINASGDIGQLVRLLKFELDREDRRVGKNLVIG